MSMQNGKIKEQKQGIERTLAKIIISQFMIKEYIKDFDITNHNIEKLSGE